MGEYIPYDFNNGCQQMVPWGGLTSESGPGAAEDMWIGPGEEGNTYCGMGSDGGQAESGDPSADEPGSPGVGALVEEDLNSRIVIDLSRFFNKKKGKKAAGRFLRGSLGSSRAKYHRAKASRCSSSKTRSLNREESSYPPRVINTEIASSSHLAKASVAWSIGKKLGLISRGSEASLVNQMEKAIEDDERAYDAWKNII